MKTYCMQIGTKSEINNYDSFLYVLKVFTFLYIEFCFFSCIQKQTKNVHNSQSLNWNVSNQSPIKLQN